MRSDLLKTINLSILDFKAKSDVEKLNGVATINLSILDFKVEYSNGIITAAIL